MLEPRIGKMPQVVSILSSCGRKDGKKRRAAVRAKDRVPLVARLQVHSSAVTEVVSLHVTMCTPEVLANFMWYIFTCIACLSKQR